MAPPVSTRSAWPSSALAAARAAARSRRVAGSRPGCSVVAATVIGRLLGNGAVRRGCHPRVVDRWPMRRARRSPGSCGAAYGARMTTVDLLHAGYLDERVGSSIVLVRDGDARIVCDPGMVSARSKILDPLAALDV